MLPPNNMSIKAKIKQVWSGIFKNNDFNNHPSSKISQITLTSDPIDNNHVTPSSYVDSLTWNDEIRGVMSLVLNGQDNEFDTESSTNLHCITVKRNPLLNGQPSKNEHADNDLDKNTILSLNRTLQNYR